MLGSPSWGPLLGAMSTQEKGTLFPSLSWLPRHASARKVGLLGGGTFFKEHLLSGNRQMAEEGKDSLHPGGGQSWPQRALVGSEEEAQRARVG